MDVLAFPFSFDASGRANVVEQHSDQHAAQQISQFVQTRVNELPLAPTYGLEDPVFRGIDESEIRAGLALFHPRITVLNINGAFKSEGVQSLSIQFDTNQRNLVSTYAAVDGQVTFNA